MRKVKQMVHGINVLRHHRAYKRKPAPIFTRSCLSASKRRSRIEIWSRLINRRIERLMRLEVQ